MANVPSMFELAIPAAAGLLYALIWYSTRSLPRAGRILGRVASLLILVPAVLYVSFGMPMHSDRVNVFIDVSWRLRGSERVRVRCSLCLLMYELVSFIKCGFSRIPHAGQVFVVSAICARSAPPSR